jgi:hypothetical protein
VPPEVTVADFVVVVGVVDEAVVVVVVVDVDFAEDDDAVRPACVAVEDEAVGETAVVALLEPGCSFATRTPMSAVVAVAATTAVCVKCRSRTRAR